MQYTDEQKQMLIRDNERLEKKAKRLLMEVQDLHGQLGQQRRLIREQKEHIKNLKSLYNDQKNK